MNNLPLLEATLADIPDGFFEDTLLIGCQHLLPSIQILVDCLIKKGLPNKNMFLIGKCYSTSPKTYSDLLKKNIYVCPSSLLFNSHKSYYADFKKNINRFLQDILPKIDLRNIKKIIILDDGGEILSQANQLDLNGIQIHGVEQTTFGYKKISNLNIKYNVVNVARSKSKLNLESIFVAKSVCRSLRKILNNNLKKILILGNGAIGNAISKILEANHEIIKYDLNFNKTDLDRKDLAALNNIELIIGCSGSNILDILLENNLLLNKPFLASASSFDIEFNGAFFRKNKLQSMDCHQVFDADNAILLNGGFPVNFDGNDKDGIPLDEYQLTLALLLKGMAQSGIYDRNSQLIDLDHDFESKLICCYKKYTDKTKFIKDDKILENA